MAIMLKPFLWLLNLLIPLGDLIARVWVGQIFLLDGWLRFHSGDIIIPFLEILLSILLILGLGGRIIILLFLIFNIISIYSGHFIWTPEGAPSLNQQIAWSMLLMLLMLHGSGKFSLDHWLHKKYGHYLKLNRRE